MAGKAPKDEDVPELDDWKGPFWQRPIKKAELALHPDGPLEAQFKEGYLQKRAGSSRIRWNIRWFEVRDNQIRWWRPDFKEMIKQPVRPKVSAMTTKPRPIRALDLTQLKSVTKTQVKFPYSTRILLSFHESYSKYQLELRAERENIIFEWYRVLSRFAIENFERNIETEPTEAGSTDVGDGSSSEDEASLPTQNATNGAGGGPASSSAGETTV